MTTEALKRFFEGGADPYAARHRVHKWNIRPTFLQEPKLAPVVFPGVTRAEHEQAALAARAEAEKGRRAWQHAIAVAERTYGTHSPLISGGFHEHWPEDVKDTIRALSAAWQRPADAAEAHWRAAGKRKPPPWRGQ